MRAAKSIQLSSDGDPHLRIFSKRKHVEARVQIRNRIVLLTAAETKDKNIAQKLDIDLRVVARWRTRSPTAGVDGLFQDATRPGRPRTARNAANVGQVLRITLEKTPRGATHCGARAPWLVLT